MKAYVYRADLYCEGCGLQIIQGLNALCWPTVMKTDSQHYPQGPYSDGGGEADTPQHCGSCGMFLENPLTPDGYHYVAERIEEYLTRGTGSPPTLEQWAEFYDCENAELNAAITKFQESQKPNYQEIAEAEGYAVYPWTRGAESGFAWGSDGVIGGSPLTTEAEAWRACCEENELI